VTLPLDITAPQSEWEDLARLDPLWAILTDRGKQFGKWNRDEFFHSGETEINHLMASCGFVVGNDGKALDFGCGVGRLSRALRPYFAEVYGVDISEEMVRLAREFTPNCRFLVNQDTKLRLFGDNYFDFIYSNRVLQHQPSRRLVENYIREFVRVVKPRGMVVFQLPFRRRLRRILQPRQRVYSVLRAVGFTPKFLYRNLRLNPIRNSSMAPEQVTAILHSAGAELIRHYPDECNEYSMTYVALKRALPKA
jgi:ubiquinone/menaquinone biosynthesis C-methylase UbiE